MGVASWSAQRPGCVAGGASLCAASLLTSALPPTACSYARLEIEECPEHRAWADGYCAGGGSVPGACPANKGALPGAMGHALAGSGTGGALLCACFYPPLAAHAHAPRHSPCPTGTPLMLSNRQGDYLVGLTSGRQCPNDTASAANATDGAGAGASRRLRTFDSDDHDSDEEDGAWGYYIDLSNKCILNQVVSWLLSRCASAASRAAPLVLQQGPAAGCMSPVPCCDAPLHSWLTCRTARATCCHAGRRQRAWPP